MTSDGILKGKRCNMLIPLAKLKAILLYFSNNTNKLGKVKLMKLIYFLDFVHIKKYGTPVTYDNYIHIEHGPIPSTIKNLIDDAASDINSSKLVDTISFQTVLTSRNPMTKILPMRDFSENDKDYFSETELEILKVVSDRFKNSSSDEIEEASHKESAWRETEYLQSIPYNLAANDADSDVTQDEIDLLLSTL